MNIDPRKPLSGGRYWRNPATGEKEYLIFDREFLNLELLVNCPNEIDYRTWQYNKHFLEGVWKMLKSLPIEQHVIMALLLKRIGTKVRITEEEYKSVWDNRDKLRITIREARYSKGHIIELVDFYDAIELDMSSLVQTDEFGIEVED